LQNTVTLLGEARASRHDSASHTDALRSPWSLFWSLSMSIVGRTSKLNAAITTRVMAANR